MQAAGAKNPLYTDRIGLSCMLQGDTCVSNSDPISPGEARRRRTQIARSDSTASGVTASRPGPPPSSQRAMNRSAAEKRSRSLRDPHKFQVGKGRCSWA